MIDAPFQADGVLAARLAGLAARVGPALEADVSAIVAASAGADAKAGSTIPAPAVADLVERHGLNSERELALLALPVARAMASPPISGYRVAAIGIEAESGDLVLGANLEFPGTDLWTTIHAEGFVALRARARRNTLETLVVPEAHPCAHCRQTLAESAAAERLEIVDLQGHELTLAELYPWPFQPAALGDPGDTPEAIAWPALAFDESAVPADVASALLDAGRRAHAPYSGAPSAVALRLRDGRVLAAGCVESVAFNPTITAAQAAFVEVTAARAAWTDVVEAWLGRTADAAIDPAAGFAALVQAAAPTAVTHVASWGTGA